MKLSCHDWLNWVWSVVETRHDNNVIDCTNVVNLKNEIEVSWLIKLVSFVTRTKHNKIVTDHIDVVHVENKTKLSC